MHRRIPGLLVTAALVAVVSFIACEAKPTKPSTSPSSGSGQFTVGAGGAATATGTTTTATTTSTASTATTGTGTTTTAASTGTSSPCFCNPLCAPGQKCVDISNGNCDMACSDGSPMQPCGKATDCDPYLTCTMSRCACPSAPCSACAMGFVCIPIGNCANICTNHVAGAFCGGTADCNSPLTCVNHVCQ